MNKNFVKLILLCGIFLVGVLVLFMSPVFVVNKIIVNGNTLVSDKNIIDLSGSINKSIIFLNKNKVNKILQENPYIKDVEIIKDYPNSLNIEIEERKPASYIKYMESAFLLADDEGYILDVVSKTKPDLPLIVGLNFEEFNIGKKLEVDNMEYINAAIEISKLAKKYSISDIVSKIDLSNIEDIHLFINNIDFTFGNIKNAEMKVRKTKAVFDEIPNNTEIKAIVYLEEDVVKIVT